MIGRGREQRQEEIARGRRRRGEIAERDQRRTDAGRRPRNSRSTGTPPCGIEARIVRRKSQPAAHAAFQPARQSRAEALRQRAHQGARVLDVPWRHRAKRHREQRTLASAARRSSCPLGVAGGIGRSAASVRVVVGRGAARATSSGVRRGRLGIAGDVSAAGRGRGRHTRRRARLADVAGRGRGRGHAAAPRARRGIRRPRTLAGSAGLRGAERAAGAASRAACGRDAVTDRSAAPARPPHARSRHPGDASGKHPIERRLEERPIALVLHERRRERVAKHAALDARYAHRRSGVYRFRDTDGDAAPAQRRDELREARPHRQRSRSTAVGDAGRVITAARLRSDRLDGVRGRSMRARHDRARSCSGAIGGPSLPVEFPRLPVAPPLLICALACRSPRSPRSSSS